MILNVLTRCCGRPNCLQRCYESVREASYYAPPRLRIEHWLHSDTDDAISWAVTACHTPREEVEGKGSFPWNLYLNTMVKEVAELYEGQDAWITFLDDDDVIAKPKDYGTLLNYHAIDEDTLLLWQVRVGGRVLPPRLGEFPRKRKITNIGHAFHIKWAHLIDFRPTKEDDYRVLKNLHDTIPHVRWIGSAPLTATQQAWGFGKRKDHEPASGG